MILLFVALALWGAFNATIAEKEASIDKSGWGFGTLTGAFMYNAVTYLAYSAMAFVLYHFVSKLW